MYVPDARTSLIDARQEALTKCHDPLISVEQGSGKPGFVLCSHRVGLPSDVHQASVSRLLSVGMPEKE